MTSIFDIDVTVGECLYTHAVTRTRLDRDTMLNHAVFKGEAKDKTGEYFCPGLMNSGVRNAVNVERCSIIALDLDTLTPKTAKRLIYMLDESGWEYLLYSTTRHTTDSPRFRVILNPSRAMTEQEYKCVVTKVSTTLAIDDLDSGSLLPYQPALMPLALADTYDQRVVKYVEGETVDIEECIVDIANFEPPIDHSVNATLDPMPIPGGLPEDNWMACVLDAWPAAGLLYHEWLYVGFAIFHQTDGRGFELWYQWSALNKDKHGRDYDKEQMRAKWISGEADMRRKGITLRYILNQRNSNRRTVGAIAYANYFETLTESRQIAEVCSDIQADKFIPMADYNRICTALIKITKKLNNDKLPRGEGMAMLRHDMVEEEPETYFFDNYLYDVLNVTYYNLVSKAEMPVSSMNYVYGSGMPLSSTGDRKIVHRVLTTQANGIRSPRAMEGVRYKVHAGDVIMANGKHYMNLYKPDSWPSGDHDWSPELDDIDEQIRDAIMLHMALLFNNDEKMITMLLQHLAHLRQRPNDRIHFAYAISSYFGGVGKSSLRRLYETVLGEAQVSVINADDVANGFNSFAGAPHLMTFIEEFEFENRREQNRAIKKMKELITGDRVSVNEKYKRQCVTPAYTAYAIFSNDEFVLGHEAGGRRWVPCVVDAVTDQQCAEVLGEDRISFFKRYHDLIGSHPERFVSYFEQLSLEGFDKDTAPDSVQKKMYQDNVPSARCQRIIEQIIEDEAQTDLTTEYTSSSVAYDLVRAHIEFATDADAELLKHQSSRALRNLVELALRAMGYRQLDRPNGVKRVRMPFDNQQRTRLDEIWVKANDERFAGSEKIDALRLAITHYKDMHAIGKPKKKRSNVLTMDRKDFDDL